MNADTIHELNAINRRFYEITADAFDATRQHPWPGWERLLPHIPAVRPLRVLDVGCGNGRFGLFLSANVQGDIHYHGVDNNPALLDRARESLTPLFSDVHLTAADAITAPLSAGVYDLVGVFGVLHHVPGYAHRRAFMRRLTGHMSPGGVLAFAAWRFYDNPRLRQKAVDWPVTLEREPGDYLLDWRRGESAVRYCHHVDDDEHAALVAAAGLREVATYRADGHDNQTNRYSVLVAP